MKRKYIWALAVAVMILLSACGAGDQAPERYCAVERVNGQELTILFDENTLSSGIVETEQGTYTFQYEAQSSGVAFMVVYPDGYVYTQTDINGGIRMPAEYDAGEREAKGYVDGWALASAVERAIDAAQGRHDRSGPSPLLAVLLLACGALNFFAPKTAWWLARGWWYRNAEPSDLACTAY